MTVTEPSPWSERLDEFFNGVVAHGCGVVLPANLLLWTRRQRITPSFWANIKAACDKALVTAGEHDNYRLYVGDGAESYTFVIWDGGEGSADGWWQSIDAMMQKKTKKSRMAQGATDEED